MKRHTKRTLEWAALIAATALAAGVTAAYHHGGKHHRSHGDVDKAADCWAHPDARGRRHCASKR